MKRHELGDRVPSSLDLLRANRLLEAELNYERERRITAEARVKQLEMQLDLSRHRPAIYGEPEAASPSASARPPSIQNFSWNGSRASTTDSMPQQEQYSCYFQLDPNASTPAPPAPAATTFHMMMSREKSAARAGDGSGNVGRWEGAMRTAAGHPGEHRSADRIGIRELSTVTVKTLTGVSIALRIDLSLATAEDVKRLVEEEEEIPVDQQRLIFQGQPLQEPTASLASVGVGPGDTLHLVLRLPTHRVGAGIASKPPAAEREIHL